MGKSPGPLAYNFKTKQPLGKLRKPQTLRYYLRRNAHSPWNVRANLCVRPFGQTIMSAPTSLSVRSQALVLGFSELAFRLFTTDSEAAAIINQKSAIHNQKSAQRAAVLIRDERQYCHMTRALDGFRKLTLMRRADSADSTRKNLSTLRNEVPEKFPILKVDVRNFFSAEFTYSLASNAKPSLPCHIFSAFLLQ